jgi:uncharacterized membrane protein
MLADKFETFRIEAFRDSVFAIAITLLIMEIKVPHEVLPGELLHALLNLWTSYLAFLTSFCTIGMMWINHHRLFTLIRSADETLIAINLVLLLVIVWNPFPTAVLAAYLREADERVAVLICSSTFLFIAVIFNLLWWYGMRNGHVPHKGSTSDPVTRQCGGAIPLCDHVLGGSLRRDWMPDLEHVARDVFLSPSSTVGTRPRLVLGGYSERHSSQGVRHGTKDKDHRLE